MRWLQGCVRLQTGNPLLLEWLFPVVRRCLLGDENNNNSKDNKKDPTVATEKSQNVQDVFLNNVRKNKTPVTVFLVNGVKLQGIITWFDNFSVLLRRDGHTQLVYKHAISTVMPGAPIQLFDATKAEGTVTLTRETVRELGTVTGD
jgi:host factor-I protein